MQEEYLFYDEHETSQEEFQINFRSFFYMLYRRKGIIIKTFLSVILFFILLTFISPKKYKVEADLYISKNNGTNLAEMNPFFLDESSASLLSTGADKVMLNELELMQSPLVIDKVIRENNFVIKKKYGFIPNKKEGEYITTKGFLRKNIKFENKKNTNVVTITYKNSKPDVAYNVVNSIIKNYIELHKDIHTEKAKSDQKIIEKEYNKAKENLNKKINNASGLPDNAASGMGMMSAMSIFSKTAQNAISSISGQVKSGEKSKIAISEEATKVSNLSSKLEWAKIVNEMSDTSKVLVLSEPRQLRDFENSSPKLIINILLGIFFGTVASLLALILSEIFDKKMSYSILGNEVIYNLDKEFDDLKLILLANQNKKIGCLLFEGLPQEKYKLLKEFSNIKFITPEISKKMTEELTKCEFIISIVKIGTTNAKFYKQIKKLLMNLGKNINEEILV